MKIIYNKLIPIRGYLVINIFGTFFVRKRKDGSNPKLSDITINHELIHTSQMKEMLYESAPRHSEAAYRVNRRI